MRYFTTVSLGLLLMICLAGAARSEPLFKAPDMDKLNTSFSMRDGVGFLQINTAWSFQKFRYRPFLDTTPPWVPELVHLISGLDGDLFFSVTLSDGTLRPLDSSCVTAVEKTPYYMKITYRMEPSVAGKGVTEKTLEILVPPNAHAMLYRWSDPTGGDYKFRTRVFADDDESMLFPRPDPPNPGEIFDFGRGVYVYEASHHAFIQTFENTWDDPKGGHAPCSGLTFLDAPDACTLTDKGEEDANSNRIQGSFEDLDGQCDKTINTGKVFFAEHRVTKPREISLAFCFADNREALDSAFAQIQSKSFDQWKQETEVYWSNYLMDAHGKIDKRLGCDLTKLNERERAVLDSNLIEERMLLATNGASFACPAAAHFFSSGSPGYYNSWIRDGAIAKLHLSSLGLEEQYLKPHAALVANNYMEADLVNGHFRWWDVFYNFCDNCAGGTEFSQSDSAFYGIWSFYKAWKLLGDDHWITDDRYQLMKDSLRYYRDGLTYDPHTQKNICYYNSDKKMFVEYRINEADITADSPVWPDASEWYRSPKTGKKFDYVLSFYINVLFYSNYRMMAEVATHNGLADEAAQFRTAADELKQALDENLWREDKSRYIAGIAFNEDGYEDIDFKWENIGFDYIWALTLPDEEHLPFDPEVKRACLQAAYDAKAWAATNFGLAEIATGLPSARQTIVDRLVNDACTVDKSGEYWYYFPFAIAEGEHNANLPQIFAIAPTLKALCLTTTDP